MPRKFEISPDTLRKLYHEEEMTLSEVGEELGCSAMTVYNRMDEHGIGRRTASANMERIQVNCANCETPKKVAQWHYDKNDCFFRDNECQGEFLEETGLSRRENNGRWKGKETVECANCSASLQVYPCRLEEKANHLCDNECRAEWYSKHLSDESHPLWDDNYDDFYSGSWRRVRDQVRERDGNTCQICSQTEDGLDRIPDVHHIRPIRTFEDPEEAHVLSNLVQLCSGCHSYMERLSPAKQRRLLNRF